MPELPDLHVFCLNLKKHVLDVPIAQATVVNGGRMNATAAAFANALAGARIEDIARGGKELFFQLTNKNSFSVHLMLSGQFHLTGAEEAGAIRQRIVTVAFEDGRALTVSDIMNLCKVSLNPKKSGVPDAFAPEFDRAYFKRAARNYAWLNVKAFLIDQKILRGIGNAYADEILWKANISPESYVGRLPEAALMELYAAIGDVLRDAIENILRISPDIIGGEERGFLRVHNPNKKATDEGEPILTKYIAEKKTYYTQKQRRF